MDSWAWQVSTVLDFVDNSQEDMVGFDDLGCFQIKLEPKLKLQNV